MKLGCTNGGIELSLPSDSKATISARITNGGIDTSGLRSKDGRDDTPPGSMDAERWRRAHRPRRHNGGIRISGR